MTNLQTPAESIVSTGLIFDIKRYAINDGPGIRVTVFFKGCPLTCAWCHNPESQSPHVQKMYTQEKCIACQACVEACEQEACVLTPEGIITDTDLCIVCGKCAQVCPTKATEMSGEARFIQDIMEVIAREKTLMDDSGGGVTFSGGEPLMHPQLLLPLLEECGQLGLHRCVDTSGLANSKGLLDVARKTELFLYDLKLMDSARHIEYTGVSNQPILSNLRLLAESGAKIIIRIPLIKNINDDDANIRASAEFIATLPGKTKEVNLLPFHNLATKKLKKMGLDVDLNGFHEPNKKRLDQIMATFEAFGLATSIGG